MFPNVTPPNPSAEFSEIHRWARLEGKSVEAVADLHRQTQLASRVTRVPGRLLIGVARVVGLWLAVRES